MTRHRHTRRGVTLLAFIGILAVISIMSMTLYTNVLSAALTTKRLERDVQVMHLAEAGLELALYTLNHETHDIQSLTEQTLGAGTFKVDVIVREDGSRIITSRGWVPSENPMLSRTVRGVIVQDEGKFVVTGKTVY